MAVSTLIVAALLAVDVGWRFELADSAGGQRLPLMIEIKRAEPTRLPPPPAEIETVEVTQAERSRLYDESMIAPVEVEPAESEPARDWSRLSSSFAEQHVENLESREQALADMWRQSPSVMFESEGGPEAVEAPDVLADLDFREPVGVAGIGFTIGSCFIGIPIIGVPVEERTVAVRLWVCR